MKYALMALLLVSFIGIADSKIGESHHKKAMVLADLMMPRDGQIKIFRMIFDRYLDSIRRKKGGLTADQVMFIQKEMDLFFESETASIDISGARVLAQHFTEKEIDELIAFTSTPVGRKMQEKKTILPKELTNHSISIMRKYSEQLQRRILKKLDGK